MIPNKQSQSQERHISPELVTEAQRRWGIVYHATDLIQASLAQLPNLFTPALPEAKYEAPKVNPTDMGAEVISLTTYREQQQLSEQEQRIAEAQRLAEEARSETAA